MSLVSPVRYPDVRSEPLMTKRAWWLVGINILIPGSAQVLAGNRRMGRFGLGATLVLWALSVVVGLIAVLDRDILLSASTTPVVLWVVVAALLFYAVLWVVYTLDTIRLVRLVRLAPGARAAVGALSVVALVVTAGTAFFGAYNGTVAAGVLGQIFGDGSIAEPVDGRYNILLLGGDAGADRVGLRPDSISVVSVDATTGQATILGIPRNLQKAPFVDGSPLYDVYPDGYDCGDTCLIDYIYQVGEQHPDLYPDAEKNGSTPAIEAVRDAAEGVLGLTIQYYVLIDMQGFAQLIDALGGVDIDVPDRTPVGANIEKNGKLIPPSSYIEAGPQHMDGATALGYARTRYKTTDYARMARQRQLQEAIIAQADPSNVVTKFQAIADAGAQVVSTDIPAGALGRFVSLAQTGRSLEITSIDFVPPDYNMVDPDFGQIRAVVQSATHPATAAPQG